MKLGIDISTWQKKYPYKKAKEEGVEFVIIRAGFSKSKDKEFETHYKNFKEINMKMGAYWFSYAVNKKSANEEAKKFLEVVKDKEFEYPLYLDIESEQQEKLSKKELDEIVEEFCSVIENAGYYVGVYTNVNWYKNKLSGKKLNQKYDWWIASWTKTAPKNINYGIWQFGGETNKVRNNKIAGIITDQNYCYRDYPEIIKNAKLNHLSKDEIDKDKSKDSIYLSDEELLNLVKRTMRGDFGNGENRKRILKDKYSIVQYQINRNLKDGHTSWEDVKLYKYEC